ncbi:MAG: hypothetical protein EOO75_09290 [Myxococcales bacterium]|nr:MAG: hypothetical protein EOO75_09290 [Myxococcales bacterium]
MELFYPDTVLSELDRIDATVTLPGASSRADLLKVAFYASLQREEGRALAFGLAFISPASIEERGHVPFSALIFEAPLPFGVEQIIKLAPALDHRLASIGVWERDGELFIWGLFRHGLSQYEMAEGLEDSSVGLGFNYLVITCEQPGRLDVDVGTSRIASFAGGELESGIQVFVEQGPIVDCLVRTARQHGDTAYVESVQRIVWAIRSARHGGTLLVLPDDDMRHLQSRYPIDPASRAAVDIRDRGRASQHNGQHQAELIRKLGDANDANEKVYPHLGMQARAAALTVWSDRAALRESVRFTASLANVDGALVLSGDLRVLAFGAMIQRPEDDAFEVRIARSAAGDSQRSIAVDRLGGARHQSAAHFCHQQPGAPAFVVSQDGRVSCFYNDGSDVWAWLGIRLDRRLLLGDA